MILLAGAESSKSHFSFFLMKVLLIRSAKKQKLSKNNGIQIITHFPFLFYYGT